MGGKGGGETIPAYTPPSPEIDYEAMIGMMGEMMIMSQMNTPQYAPPPAITSEPAVDWAARQKELQTKVDADVTAELRRKRGRASTVLTSPLVNEEDPDIVQTKPTGAKSAY